MAKIICKYNVTSITEPTAICFTTEGFSDILLDGVSIGLVTGYTFVNVGANTLEFVLKDTVIPLNSFGLCYDLVEVEIGEGVETIGDGVFTNCGIVAITIPQSVKSIGSNAFLSCGKLDTIEVRATTAPTISRDTFTNVRNIGVLYYPEGSDYSSWFGDNPYYLGWGSSNDWRGEYIDVHTEMTCTYMSVYTPQYATPIVNSSWSAYCIYHNGIPIGRVKEYTFSSDEEHTLTFVFNGKKIPDQAFYQNRVITSAVIGDSVETIGYGAFWGCDSLESVVIGDSVETLEYGVFRECDSLDSLVIGESVRTIDSWAFANCGKLDTIEIKALLAPAIQDDTFIYMTEYGTLIYPKGSDYSTWLSEEPYYLGYYHWNYTPPIVKCTYDVRDITEPYSICYTTEGFSDILIDGISVGLLTGYTFDSLGEHTVEFILKDKTVIPADSFRTPDGLISVILPPDIVSIGDRAFYGAAAITSIVIPDSVKTIGEDCFNGCRSLSDVTIGMGCESIGKYAFEGCSSLVSITITAVEAPILSPDKMVFVGVQHFGTLTYPYGSDYSSWLEDIDGRLGYYSWNGINGSGIGLSYSSIEANTGNDYSIEVTYYKMMSYSPVIKEGDWIEVEGSTISEQTDDYTKITYFYVVDTNEGVTREGNIKFSGVNNEGYSITKELNITQTNMSNIVYNPPTMEFYGAGGSSELQVTFTEFRQIFNPTPSATWLTITEKSSEINANTTTKTYTVGCGKIGVAERSAHITFNGILNNGQTYIEDYQVVQHLGGGSDSGDTETSKVSPFQTSYTVKASATTGTIRVGYNNVTINEPTVVSDFFNIGTPTTVSGTFVGYDEVYEYPLTFEVNSETSSRTGTITFSGVDGESVTVTGVATVTQEGAVDEPDEPDVPADSDEVYVGSIWKDVEYNFGGKISTEFSIYAKGYMVDDILLYRGKAWKAPTEDSLKVIINKICQNYFPDSVLPLDDGTVGISSNYRTFILKGEYGNVLRTYRFVNDWSYQPLLTGLKTNPIIPYIADGQRLFFSYFSYDSSKYIKYGIDYYDGTPSYSNNEYITDDLFTSILPVSRSIGASRFWFADKEFRVLPSCKCRFVLYYQNPYGGWDWFPILGKIKRVDEVTPYSYTKNYNNTTVGFGKSRYLSEISIGYELNTGWITQEMSNRMWELLESNSVYLHNLETDEIEPVVIQNTSIEHKKRDRVNKIIQYTINVEFSQTRERL